MASRDDWGIIALSYGDIIWVTSATRCECQVACFSPKPHFVYKWWLYVKTFCLSSEQCLGSLFYSTHTAHWHHKHTLKHTLLYCLVHCNMNEVSLLQSKFKPLHFSLSSVYVQIDQILSYFRFKYFATWRCKASCIYDLQSIWVCRYVVKLYCECVNNNDGLLFSWYFLLIFLTRHV